MWLALVFGKTLGSGTIPGHKYALQATIDGDIAAVQTTNKTQSNLK
jgi:hypothetical protein